MLYSMQPMMCGDLVVQRHSEQHYKVLFNQKTGAFIRMEDDGYEEPFWCRRGPELIDMSITNYCTRECGFCYRKSNPSGKHLSMEDIQEVVCQVHDAGVLQIALGGGNPNQHPHFVEILRMIRKAGIVPSYTTNGMGLTDEILKATAQYCGAMAVSLYAPYDLDYYSCLVERISSYGIRLNLHVILKENIIGMLTEWLHNPPSFFGQLNAIVFLNYKPAGREWKDAVENKNLLKQFFEAAAECRSVKIGFDSCSMSGIVQWMKGVNPVSLELCEAARFSAFISEDMKVYPCSFMVDTDQYGDLRKSSLKEIWKESAAFRSFREKVLGNNCQKCDYSKICNGGCLFLPEINMCKKQ